MIPVPLFNETEHERLAWRAVALAALDELHASAIVILRQREQLAELRDERTRLARTLFGEPQ